MQVIEITYRLVENIVNIFIFVHFGFCFKILNIYVGVFLSVFGDAVFEFGKYIVKYVI